MNRVERNLETIFQFLNTIDYEVASRLKSLNKAFFSLSWILALFCHEIRNSDDAKRVLLFILTQPPQIIMFMTVSLIMDNQNVICCSSDDEGVLFNKLKRLPASAIWSQVFENSQRLANRANARSLLVYLPLLTTVVLAFILNSQ